MFSTIYYYYKYLFYFILNNKKIDECKFLSNKKNDILTHIYCLSLNYKLWNTIHYRNTSFKKDIKDNLSNICIPSTGICLSILVCNKYIYLFSLLVINPLICFVYSILMLIFRFKNPNIIFKKNLLYPDSWFWIWRKNCTLVQYHYHKTNSKNYEFENKKKFLEKVDMLNFPITPYVKNDFILKNINIEGGMGIHTYRNAFQNGDWIIQPKLNNNNFLKKILPNDSPLSTIRIVTCFDNCDYKSLSAVLRAGFSNEKTDHKSILFNINLKTGVIEYGKKNDNWYKIGFKNLCNSNNILKNIYFKKHTETNKLVTTKEIPDFLKITNICEQVHKKLLPDIPIAGWDIALTEEIGICLVEVNLSCNLFCAEFDKKFYNKFLYNWFTNLDNYKIFKD